MTHSRRLIFGDLDPQQNTTRDDAKQIIKRLAERSFRRTVAESDLSTPMKFFDTAIVEGGFESGIEIALASLLVNPNFLFKIETDQDIKSMTFPISDVELATRLSYFLWSSLPDDELLNLAIENRLSDPDVLTQQVDRMLADERSDSLVENFASQWLYLRNLESITPNLRTFPDFDDNLRQSFRLETQHLFKDVMRNDLSVLGLVRSDHTFLNERLATHYEIPNVNGSEFRKVKLPSESRRGGILRHGSILMVTSYATRTSANNSGQLDPQEYFGYARTASAAEHSQSKRKHNDRCQYATGTIGPTQSRPSLRKLP